MNDRYVLIYRPDDEEAPINLRTYNLASARARAQALNAWIRDNPQVASKGRWTVHELRPEEEQ